MSRKRISLKRSCQFCGKFFSRLTKYLIAIHKERVHFCKLKQQAAIRPEGQNFRGLKE